MVRVAVTVAVLLPTEVVNDPDGIVFVPLRMPVTMTETEHDAPGGITVPVPTTKVLKPGVAVSAGLLAQVLAADDGEKLVI